MDIDGTQVIWVTEHGSGVWPVRAVLDGEKVGHFSFRADLAHPDGLWRGFFEGPYSGLRWPESNRLGEFSTLLDGIELFEIVLKASEEEIRRIKRAREKATREIEGLHEALQ